VDARGGGGRWLGAASKDLSQQSDWDLIVQCFTFMQKWISQSGYFFSPPDGYPEMIRGMVNPDELARVLKYITVDISDTTVEIKYRDGSVRQIVRTVNGVSTVLKSNAAAAAGDMTKIGHEELRVMFQEIFPDIDMAGTVFHRFFGVVD
jgi:hypothetical protein